MDEKPMQKRTMNRRGELPPAYANQAERHGSTNEPAEVHKQGVDGAVTNHPSDSGSSQTRQPHLFSCVTLREAQFSTLYMPPFNMCLGWVQNRPKTSAKSADVSTVMDQMYVQIIGKFRSAKMFGYKFRVE